MKVKEWIAYIDIEEYKEAPCGGMGDWFNWKEKGQRWKDYIELCEPEAVPYLEAIRSSVLEKKLKITGQQHQFIENGVPLFEDNTVALFTFRGWGDLMAAIWSEEEDIDYDYMDFYM